MGRRTRKLKGRVNKVIRSRDPNEPEKAEIDIKEADHLYREIRVPNVVTDGQGNDATLKEGAEVDVIVEADSSATLKKPKGLR